MNIVIMGPQGSGKGTQAGLMAEKLGFYQMETGKLLRQKAKKDKRIWGMLSEGTIVPTEDVIGIIEDAIGTNGDSYADMVFDGFPRRIDQYEYLKDWLKKRGQKLDAVLFLDIGKDETIRRLSSRRTCVACGAVYNLITNPPQTDGKCNCGGNLIQRDDDYPEAIEKRLNNFYKETMPIIDMAENDGIMIKINGERPIEEIFEDITMKVEELRENEKSAH